MELEVKLYILDDEGKKFMGKGVLTLLEEIGRSSSLREASKRMDLSYSKAFYMLKHLEETVGRPLVIRKHGGAKREGIELTPFAKEYIALYLDFQKEAKEEAEKSFLLYKEKVEKLTEVYDGRE